MLTIMMVLKAPLPCWEWGSPLLLARGIHMDHSEMLCDLLHVLKVEQGVEAGLICRWKRHAPET